MPEPGIPGTVCLLKSKAIMSTACIAKDFNPKTDSAARPIRGPKTGVRRPLCGHQDTASGGKRGAAAPQNIDPDKEPCH